MARDKISEYDATAANNTVVGDVNIAEACPPSGINNALREICSHLKEMDVGTFPLTSPEFTGATVTNELEAGSLDINGVVQIDGAVTVGVNDTGFDVKMFGATSGAYLLWDESADDLMLVGAAGLSVAGATAVAGLSHSGDITGTDAAGPGILNEAATSTNPTVVPNRADPDTGVGWGATNELSCITAGAERMRIKSDGDIIMPDISSSTQTAFRPPFIDFQIAANNPSGVHKGIYWHSVTASAVDRSYGAIWRDQASGNLHIDSQTDQVFSTTTSSTERMRIASAGTVNVVGTFTAGTKTFKIDHPLPAKTDTHYLLHSSIEGPQADLIYRGRADLVSGVATVNIDTVSNMTDGTFVALCGDVQCFTSNEDGWTALKGSVAGNVLTITAQDNACTDTVSWMVIGERKDAKMIESEWADNAGKLIVETLKSDHDDQPEEGP
ncbi:putative endosialidase [uncultured Mediterranean phage uvDeep-CGR0-AD1-C123]|nr:putative endosialidase [uncultured Mediterranean phage uvDeep-CGR0-AD1-C123]